MYSLIRPLLFAMDAERAHHLSLKAVSLAGRVPFAQRMLRNRYVVRDERLRTTVCGLVFANPVGLAAGYDKNGIAIDGLSALGFGHLEIGTLTLKPQPGNPKPRVHRVREAQGVINALGFPNEGAGEFLRRQMTDDRRRTTVDRRPSSPIGINLGKGKDTPLERAADDYCELLRRVSGMANYIAINISSPNTPELRKLQTRAFVERLLGDIARARDEIAVGKKMPVFVKIAPDLSDGELDDVLAAIESTGMDGIIATNTTLSRDGIPARYAEIKGGLSGAPLRARATDMIRKIYARTSGRLPIIGAGGIDSAEAAIEKLRAGASLVQVYTGLVYIGPGLVRRINLGLLRECERVGVQNASMLIGQPAP